MQERYKTRGTCAREIVFEVDSDNVVTYLHFVNGCGGNLQGISKLVIGQKAEEVIKKLKGIPCQNGTSCPDQLCEALENYLKNKENK
ncbi:MAG: TIGR03905 family TSCPD domain-containing protein [Firmicutes bacterium]|nr:TIGR03905 family TSCPD domain-containing protein [Bacillota bacterium]